jgi:ribonuclease HI
MIVTVYCDASTLPDYDDRSGIGVIVTLFGEVYKTIGMYVGELRNTDAELLGILMALKEAREVDKVDTVNLVRVCCDCIPAIDLAVGDAQIVSADRVEASRILEKIDELTFAMSCPVEYQWVRAHNGNKYNELADELAYEHAQPLE